MTHRAATMDRAEIGRISRAAFTHVSVWCQSVRAKMALPENAPRPSCDRAQYLLHTYIEGQRCSKRRLTIASAARVSPCSSVLVQQLAKLLSSLSPARLRRLLRNQFAPRWAEGSARRFPPKVPPVSLAPGDVDIPDDCHQRPRHRQERAGRLDRRREPQRAAGLHRHGHRRHVHSGGKSLLVTRSCRLVRPCLADTPLPFLEKIGRS